MCTCLIILECMNVEASQNMCLKKHDYDKINMHNKALFM